MTICVGLRREPLDAQVVVQEDRGDLDAVKQVLHVAVGLRQLLDLRLQLGVDRLHFFVEGLQFLLGTVQFFVGALQFLVVRLQLLIRGAEFLLGGLHFFDGGLKALARAAEFLFQFGRRDRRVRRRRRRSAAAPMGLLHGRLLEHHQEHTPQGSRLGKRPDREVDGREAAVGLDLHAAGGNGGLSCRGVVDGNAKFLAQPLAGHRKDIVVDLSRRRLQVLSGASVDIEDVALGS